MIIVHARKLLTAAVALGCVLALGTAVSQAGKLSQRPIKKLSFDPKAEQVELFSAIEQEIVDYTMIMQDSKEGTLFIENKTDKPVSVQMPLSLVGVQVLPQFDDGLSGGSSTGGGGGAQQSVGGGGQTGFGGGMNTGGAGFFSIPAQKMIAVPLKTVCLEYGKKEPTPKAEYKLVRAEEFTEDATLQELLVLIGTGKINQDVAQAAAWHISNKMSWAELASKTRNNLGPAGPQRFFSDAHLFAAQNIVATAQAKAIEKQEDVTASSSTPAAPAVAPRRTR